jgi:hypothetical protein
MRRRITSSGNVAVAVKKPDTQPDAKLIPAGTSALCILVLLLLLLSAASKLLLLLVLLLLAPS